jgi:hypothetical protein
LSSLAPAVTLSDRILLALRGLIREELPQLTFFGLYEMLVQNVASDGTTADLAPTDPTLGLPSVVKVPLRLPLMTATFTVGAKALVAFVNGDPTRPFVLTADLASALALGTSATSVTLSGGGLGALATATGMTQLRTVLGNLATGLGAVTTIAQVAALGPAMTTGLSGITNASTAKVTGA